MAGDSARVELIPSRVWLALIDSVFGLVILVAIVECVTGTLRGWQIFLVAAFSSTSVLVAVRNARTRLIADDSGLEVRNSLRTHHLRWDQVEAIAQWIPFTNIFVVETTNGRNIRVEAASYCRPLRCEETVAQMRRWIA
jgi:hypothetical protein